MNASCFDSLRASTLEWLPELGIGWYPVTSQPYDANYWVRYRAMDETPVGEKLTNARLALVDAYWDGELVDVGIGGGRFVSDRHAYGYDINPHAVEWLKSENAWLNPYAQKVDAASFWDSLEHIHDPGPLLDNVRHYVFVSLPIFTNAAHILRSKHFRKDEHCWYFTRQGFERFMARFDFRLIHANKMEQAWREDIETFVFERAK